MATEIPASKPQISGIVSAAPATAPKLAVVKQIVDGPTGEAILDAPTRATQQTAINGLAGAINKFAETDVLNASAPQPVVPVGTSPEAVAKQTQSETAARQFTQENGEFSAAIKARVSRYLTSTTTPDNAEIAAAEIARMDLRRKGTQVPYAETAGTPGPSPARNPADRSMGDNVLDGAQVPQGRPGPGMAMASPAAGGAAEPEKASRATAPVTAPSSRADAVFASVGAVERSVPAPVKASVANLTSAVAASPIVVARPTGRVFANIAPAIVIEPRFEDVPLPSRRNAGLGTVQAPLGITHQNTTVMGDGLGTVSALAAAKRTPQEAPAPTPKPMPKAMSVPTASLGR